MRTNTASVKVYYEDVIHKEGSQDKAVLEALLEIGQPCSSRMILRHINRNSYVMDLIALRRSVSNLSNPKFYDPTPIYSYKNDKCPISGKTVNFWSPSGNTKQLPIKF